jgi:hypothetical protein
VLIPNLLMWVAAGVAAAWKISQLARLPRDGNLRVVTACTVLVFLALTAQLAVSGVVAVVPSEYAKLIQNCVLALFFALLLILLSSTVNNDSGRPGAADLVLALLVITGLVVITITTPAPVRGAAYEAVRDPHNLAFYLLGNAYMAYACARGGWLAWASAGRTRSRARLGLRVAAAGLTVNLLGTHLPRVIHTAGQLIFHRELLPGTEAWTTPVLAIGIVIFFLGIGYPGARTGLIKARYWIEIRQRHHQLRPLWAALYQRFPKIALFPAVSMARELCQFRKLPIRYYRRVMECRDGLLYLSGMIDTPVDLTIPTPAQAPLVRAMLDATPPTSARAVVPPVIAAPSTAGMDADARELVALSRALRRLPAGSSEPLCSSDPAPMN